MTPYWSYESLQYVMWARSMTLAIRKLKCWVNAILPITFIKEMNKLVTLSMKHDQKANLKSAQNPLLCCCTLCVCKPYTWASRSDCEWHLIYKAAQESVREWSWKCQGVCEAMPCGCLTSRWLIAPLPPSSDRGGSGTGALRWTDCVTGQGGTKTASTGTDHH